MIWVVWLFLLLLSPRALAWNEPDNFRGIPWGASEATLFQNKTIRIHKVHRQTQDEILKDVREGRNPWREDAQVPDCWTMPDSNLRACAADFDIGPALVLGTFYFRHGGFARVTMAFGAERFPALQEIFVQRYGSATQIDRIPMVTLGGAGLMNEVLRWSGSKVMIELHRYSQKVTEGYALVMTTKEAEEQARQRREFIKKGRGDL